MKTKMSKLANNKYVIDDEICDKSVTHSVQMYIKFLNLNST